MGLGEVALALCPVELQLRFAHFELDLVLRKLDVVSSALELSLPFLELLLSRKHCREQEESGECGYGCAFHGVLRVVGIVAHRPRERS